MIVFFYCRCKEFWPGKPSLLRHMKKLHNVTSVVINCHNTSKEKLTLNEHVKKIYISVINAIEILQRRFFLMLMLILYITGFSFYAKNVNSRGTLKEIYRFIICVCKGLDVHCLMRGLCKKKPWQNILIPAFGKWKLFVRVVWYFHGKMVLCP